MQIALLATGGTFDKEYNELNGELYFKDTHLGEMLQLARSDLEITIETLMMVDSLDMTAKERHYIADICATIPQNNIVITHGTDTMVETAQVIAWRNLHKTIVLTGAMIPYKFGSSDGLFNLGSALAFSQVLEKGVYLAMNGRYFNYNNVKKNKETGKFYSLLASAAGAS